MESNGSPVSNRPLSLLKPQSAGRSVCGTLERFCNAFIGLCWGAAALCERVGAEEGWRPVIQGCFLAPVTLWPRDKAAAPQIAVCPSLRKSPFVLCCFLCRLSAATCGIVSTSYFIFTPVARLISSFPFEALSRQTWACQGSAAELRRRAGQTTAWGRASEAGNCPEWRPWAKDAAARSHGSRGKAGKNLKV